MIFPSDTLKRPLRSPASRSRTQVSFSTTASIQPFQAGTFDILWSRKPSRSAQSSLRPHQLMRPEENARGILWRHPATVAVLRMSGVNAGRICSPASPTRNRERAADALDDLNRSNAAGPLKSLFS
jgi:hypothetical protein